MEYKIPFKGIINGSPARDGSLRCRGRFGQLRQGGHALAHIATGGDAASF